MRGSKMEVLGFSIKPGMNVVQEGVLQATCYLHLKYILNSIYIYYAIPSNMGVLFNLEIMFGMEFN